MKRFDMQTNEEWKLWEEAVRRSYRASVPEDEYNAKATPDAVTKVAYYVRGLGIDIAYLDDTSDEMPNSTVQLLMDFLAFNDDLSVEDMRRFYPVAE